MVLREPTSWQTKSLALILLVNTIMSKHTSKYYQLIKVIRNEKQYANMQRALRQQRLKLKTDKDNLQLNEQLIAEIIDHDNSIEMDQKDLTVAGNQPHLETLQAESDRLWLNFCKKRVNSQFSLPMQKKLNKMKDQGRINQIIAEQQEIKASNTTKINDITQKTRIQSIQLDTLKQNLNHYKLQLDSCDMELAKLKTDFDNEQKNLNQRSNKFKEQKSKDIMIKNIDREDNQMRNAMISRIKLNQELDLGFTLQRRRAFNQAKQAINEKKKKANQSYTQVKTSYDKILQQKQQFQQEKTMLEQKNKLIDRQIAFFLKQLIKNFEAHSKGIKWMVDKLLQLNQTVSADIFPENIYTQDKEFLQMVFRDAGKSTPKVKTKSKSSMFASTPDTTPKNKPRLFHAFKTEPDSIKDNDFNQVIKLTKTDSRQLGGTANKQSMTKVYFDADNDATETVQPTKWRTESRKFNITSPSLKKIYESTGQVISGLIKRKEWNYQSCKIISGRNSQEQERQDNSDCKHIEGKLKQKFLHVRQHVRRNQLKKFIFGEGQQK